ncbi:hypothetical protein M9Y10_044921 [Tritrichomonas musculus]|uniref:Uncharacterized protein n=1 Tax=Tritrichomonas musculus TaxID=1915356 RepID=A0ABR2JU46_9EUKA
MSKFESSTSNEKAIQKRFERMQIMSVIPLTVGPEYSSPEIVSALDQNWEVYQNTISNYSQALEYGNKKSHFMPVFTEDPFTKKDYFSYGHTSYQPYFHNSSSLLPEPASYYPDYKCTVPSPPKHQIQSLQEQRPIQNATTSDIVKNYSLNMRTFNPDNISNISDNYETANGFQIPDHKIHSTFTEQKGRDEFFPGKTLTSDHDFYVPSSEFSQPKSTQKKFKKSSFDFDSMLDREDFQKADSGRDYSQQAFEQFLKLNDKSHLTPNLQRQSLRYRPPHKNSRVSFLDNLATEQSVLLNKISKPRASSVISNSNSNNIVAQSVLKGQIRASFQKQLPRDDFMPQNMKKETFSESKYHIDTGKSLKRIWPRVPTTKIYPPTKHQSQKSKNFWSPS